MQKMIKRYLRRYFSNACFHISGFSLYRKLNDRKNNYGYTPLLVKLETFITNIYLYIILLIYLHCIFTGKTMENVRKHRSIELTHTEKRLQKLSAKSTYKLHRIFSEDLVGVELNRIKVKLNKPIYLGAAILDLSKHTMYDFFYNHLKKLYGDDRMRLLATDTDSLIVWLQTDDLFQDMLQHAHLFDTSDFPKDHFLHSDLNKKIMGRMKSETNEGCISEFCGLRSKMYAFKCENTESKRAKGIKLSAQKNLRLEDYKNVLFNTSQMYSQMHALRSYNHQIFLENINKVGLSSFCSKRFLRDCGIKSYAYGSYKIKQ